MGIIKDPLYNNMLNNLKMILKTVKHLSHKRGVFLGSKDTTSQYCGLGQVGFPTGLPIVSHKAVSPFSQPKVSPALRT